MESSLEIVVSLFIAFAILMYLIYTLMKPEKF
ncbi:MAG: potassium-transporting ATPase subunit F [Melioribacter sp.]|nr:potassium-transporting ATPase subunit F [Melioribacter sp.]